MAALRYGTEVRPRNPIMPDTDKRSGELVGRILASRLFAEPPLQLETPLGAHEFAPLFLLLLEYMRPRRLLEVGTTSGASYGALCAAVRACRLETRCICIPGQTAPFDGSSARALDFRRHHDARYAAFSTVLDRPSADACNDLGIGEGVNLLHIVTGDSPQKLQDLALRWLPRLKPSGVALISGRGALAAGLLSGPLDGIAGRYCARTLQLENWMAIFSAQPVGIARDWLLAPPPEYALACKLLRLCSEHLDLQNRLSELGRNHLDLERRRVALEDKAAQLATRLARVEQAELDAQIRYGHTDLRLDQMWAEKEEFRRQVQAPAGKALEEISAEESTVPGFAPALGVIETLSQRYAGVAPPRSLHGRKLWDEAGRTILQSVLGQGTPLVFPAHLKPAVSIIVILRNQAHLSVLGLTALLQQTRQDYELLIVDNESRDETSDLLRLCRGATVIRNRENLGFSPAAMQAASAARGEFLCLLNNDALLERNALERIVQVFSGRPDAGAVGGRVLLADGKLQEAGCILWRDGRAKQYGRGENPFQPQFRFQRPVNYVSGVFLVTPAKLFAQLGGFDHRYAPAYYEDVDYCLKVWEAGRSVIYEPRAMLHHYEGASSQSSSAARQLIVDNHQRFTTRWRQVLRRHANASPRNVIRARIAAEYAAKRSLFFVRKLPATLDDYRADATLQKLDQRAREGCPVSCLYLEESGQGNRSVFPVAVELCLLSAMNPEEIEDHCAAADEIVVAPGLAMRASLQRLLESVPADRVAPAR
jgi:GT2 family glycosyltransferase